MKNRKIRLTEESLYQIINNSVKRILNEESIGLDSEIYELYNNLKNSIGADKLCDELIGKMDEMTLKHALEDIDSMYNANKGF